MPAQPGSRAAAWCAPLALITFAAFGPGIAAAQNFSSDQVSELLSAAKAQALVVSTDFSTLDFFAGSEAGWQSHASIVNFYQQHISALRQLAAKLDAARSAATPWQTTTIERIQPLLVELAAYAESVIDRTNQNASRLGTGEYKAYLKLTSEVTAELAALVADFVDYGETRQQLERLSKDPDPPAR